MARKVYIVNGLQGSGKSRLGDAVNDLASDSFVAKDLDDFTQAVLNPGWAHLETQPTSVGAIAGGIGFSFGLTDRQKEIKQRFESVLPVYIGVIIVLIISQGAAGVAVNRRLKSRPLWQRMLAILASNIALFQTYFAILTSHLMSRARSDLKKWVDAQKAEKTIVLVGLDELPGVLFGSTSVLPDNVQVERRYYIDTPLDVAASRAFDRNIQKGISREDQRASQTAFLKRSVIQPMEKLYSNKQFYMKQRNPLDILTDIIGEFDQNSDYALAIKELEEKNLLFFNRSPVAFRTQPDIWRALLG